MAHPHSDIEVEVSAPQHHTPNTASRAPAAKTPSMSLMAMLDSMDDELLKDPEDSSDVPFKNHSTPFLADTSATSPQSDHDSSTADQPGATLNGGPTAYTLSRAIKTINYKFTDLGEGLVKRYSETEDLEERLALHYGIAVANYELLIKLAVPEHWVISEDLKKNIALFVKAFALSPTVTSYRGNGAEMILKAMRESNILGLPSADEAIPTQEVISAIGQNLTTFRSTIKAKIRTSLNPNSKTRNLVDLANDLVSATRIPITLRLLIRLAFLRFCIRSFDDANPQVRDTWSGVDQNLVMLREKADTKEKLKKYFRGFYDSDIAEYGDPANSKHKVIPSDKDAPSWIKAVNVCATEVVASVATQNGVKRKQPDDEAED